MAEVPLHYPILSSLRDIVNLLASGKVPVSVCVHMCVMYTVCVVCVVCVCVVCLRVFCVFVCVGVCMCGCMCVYMCMGRGEWVA